MLAKYLKGKIHRATITQTNVAVSYTHLTLPTN